MPELFISYRRADEAGYAGRLADALAAAIGADAVFRDIDDIRPGEDFVAALQEQLARVDVLVALIGPAWLTASRNGKRRIDEADDFVRMEIETALRAGKPVLPVLVGGALMPEQKDLPPPLAALARHQAFVLSDATWAGDVARLVHAINTTLPPGRRRLGRHRALWAAAIALCAVTALGLARFWPEPSAPADRQPGAATAATFAGRWTARVSYDWGAVHEERFVFEVDDGQLHGSASYLGVPRILEQGQLRDQRLSFVTRSREALGDGAERAVTHRYRGAVKGDELSLVLESSGGYSTHSPVPFVARRAAP